MRSLLFFLLGALASAGVMVALDRMGRPGEVNVAPRTANEPDAMMLTEEKTTSSVPVEASRPAPVSENAGPAPLAAKDSSGVSVVPVPDRMRAHAPEDRQAWLENLRSEDPVRYQEIMERREAARRSTEYELAKRAAHFLYDDQELATEEEALQRVRLLKLLEESMDLTDKLSTVQSEEQRREIGRTIRENMRELSPLLEAERDREFFRIGKDIGYTDDDAAAFALYVRDVIDMTSTRSIFREGMRAMGGGGPWGGDRVRP